MLMNQAQQEAVLHKNGPMLVLAGPGSGKTLVITERTKYLINEYNIPPQEILVITFTKAAANEMKERFLLSIKKESTGVNFGTFHAVFFTILKYAYRYNASNIIREEVRVQIIRELIHQFHMEYEDEKEFINELLSEISLIKGDRIDINNYYSVNCSSEIFRDIYRGYEKKLRVSNLIDFDDMLVLCHQLLAERKDILAFWQNKFQYILIDEFQDINKIQYDIIRMLAKPQDNLFVVGDDDQSIYRFRGAKPEIMLKFHEDYKNAKQVLLDINYRSTSTIVTAASKLVSCNVKRYSKRISSIKKQGKDIVIKHFDTLLMENQAIADEVLKLNKAGIELSRMAILVRTNLGYGSLLHKLMEYNISFLMKDNIPNIYDHWIAKDILAYISIAMGKTDRSYYLQIINRPKRYISRECFDTAEVNLLHVKDYYEDKSWVLERLDKLEYDLSLIGRTNPFAAINYIRRGIGYDEYLEEYAIQRRIKLEELTEVLDELQENAREFNTYAEWFAHIEQYKEELKKQVMESKNKDKDSLTIATMHGSKGLEYEVVFIIDANEGITPHKKAVLDSDIEEERRLFYVAMTRAKESLYIFSVKERYNKTMQASRFIREIQS